MIWLILGFVISAPLFFHIGWYGKQFIESLKSIKEQVSKKPEPEHPATVTPGAYKVPDENYQTQYIVNRKTPQQIEYDNQMQVRRDNGLTL